MDKDFVLEADDLQNERDLTRICTDRLIGLSVSKDLEGYDEQTIVWAANLLAHYGTELQRRIDEGEQ